MHIYFVFYFYNINVRHLTFNSISNDYVNVYILNAVVFFFKEYYCGFLCKEIE